MTKLKALYALQCKDYVLEKHGEAGIERVRAEMDPAASAAVYSPLLNATDWIEVTYALEHAAAYDRAFRAGREWEASYRMITELVARHWHGLYRSMFASTATPLMVLEKSSRLWSRFYDAGESLVVKVGPTSILKRIINCPDLPLHHDQLTTPYYSELLRQAGARTVTARHTKCVALGAEHCETAIQWRDPD